jgi:hypothetical protein
MIAKALEVRDSGTFIPVLCVDMNPGVNNEQEYLLHRCGYPCNGRPNILVTRLDGNGSATNDYYAWGDRTFYVAHRHIIEHWHELSDGDVVDVEFILGETSKKKPSEREIMINYLNGGNL